MSAPPPRPGILSIDPYVGGKARLPGQTQVMRLASNESPLGPSPRAVAAYQALTDHLHRYPDGSSTDLREAIGQRFGLDPARIVCGAGSDELITLLARSYAGPDDEVLYSQYGFVMYPIVATSAGATPVAAPERNFTTDIDAMIAAVTPRTKVVFLANPNNPTGTYVDGPALARLHRALPASTLLVIDAAYAEYVSRNDYSNGVELVEANENVVMTRTFSKIYALSALRLGWAYCSAEVADVLNRVRGPFNVNAPAQAAGVAAIQDVAFTDLSRSHNDRWLPKLTEALRGLGLEVVPSVGNFILVRFATEGTRTAAAANAFLNQRGIIPRAVANYGLPDCLRITIGTDTEMKAVIATLTEFMAR
jgi:histidinol-phosphate aminotransferase